MDMKIFIDAGGKAGHKRVWGGLAVIGDSEIEWMRNILDNIVKTYNLDSKELKGRDLSIEEIKSTGRKIRDEDHRILFWANSLQSWNGKEAQELIKMLSKALKSMKPNPYNLSKEKIGAYYDMQASYFSDLKPINQYKILSIIVHLRWIINEIERCKLGHQLKSVEVFIDKENFPNEENCGVLIKHVVSAGLQKAGMHYILSGKAFKERAKEGAVNINVSGNSEEIVGVRFVDILLQAVLRKVMPIK